MDDVYVTNGTNIGRILAVVAIGTTPTMLLERMDTHTLIAVPYNAPNVTTVQVCIQCHFRPKLTNATGEVVSDLCSVDQAARATTMKQVEAAIARAPQTETD